MLSNSEHLGDAGLVEPYGGDDAEESFQQFQLCDLDTGEEAGVYNTATGAGASEIVLQPGAPFTEEEALRAVLDLQNAAPRAMSSPERSGSRRDILNAELREGGVPKTHPYTQAASPSRATPSSTPVLAAVDASPVTHPLNNTAVGIEGSLLLPLGQPVDAVVAGHAEVKDGKAQTYMTYVVLVARVTPSADSPPAWTVFRRYRDFLGLHDALRKHGVTVLPPLPGKRWLMQPDDEFLTKRQSGLAAWMTAVMTHFNSTPLLPELHTFLVESADVMPRGLDAGQYVSATSSVEAYTKALLSARTGLQSGGSTPVTSSGSHTHASSSPLAMLSSLLLVGGGGGGGVKDVSSTGESEMMAKSPSCNSLVSATGGSSGDGATAATATATAANANARLVGMPTDDSAETGLRSSGASPASDGSYGLTPPASQCDSPSSSVVTIHRAHAHVTILPSLDMASVLTTSVTSTLNTTVTTSATARGSGEVGARGDLTSARSATGIGSVLHSSRQVLLAPLGFTTTVTTATTPVSSHATSAVTGTHTSLSAAAVVGAATGMASRATGLTQLTTASATHLHVHFPRAGVVLAPIVTPTPPVSPAATGTTTTTAATTSPSDATAGKPTTASAALEVPPAPKPTPTPFVPMDSQPLRVIRTEGRPMGAHIPRMRASSMLVRHICLDDFELLKVVGKGSFGKVLLVKRKGSLGGGDEGGETLYAMKILSKANIVKRKQVEHTITERRVLGYTRHPFVIQLHYAFQTREKLFLVVDYAAGGEIFFHLGRLGRFKESMACFYAAQLVLALGHLHKLGIVYRDLKPENVLLDAGGHVKLADFGLSKEGITTSTDGTKSFCGTPEYLAPEVLNRTGHGTAVDWWSLGALIFEMLTGLPPWYTGDRKKLYERLRTAPLEFPTYLSESARSLISGLLTRDASLRLGSRRDAADLMSHPFFAHVDWTALYQRKVVPPFIPQLRGGESDTRYFDTQFTELPPNTALDDEKASPPNPAAVVAALASQGIERSSSNASLTNSLFANFTYEGPGYLASRLSRGASMSFSASTPIGSMGAEGGVGVGGCGRDGVSVLSTAVSGMKRVASGQAASAAAWAHSSGGGGGACGSGGGVAGPPVARSFSNEIAAGMAAARLGDLSYASPHGYPAPGGTPYTPSGLTQLLRDDGSAKVLHTVRSNLGPGGGGGGGAPTRPTPIHGASPALRIAAPTGVLPVSPLTPTGTASRFPLLQGASERVHGASGGGGGLVTGSSASTPLLAAPSYYEGPLHAHATTTPPLRTSSAVHSVRSMGGGSTSARAVGSSSSARGVPTGVHPYSTGSGNYAPR